MATHDDEWAPPPFLLKLFYRTGAFHRPDEFAPPDLPPYVPIYTYPECTLAELAEHLAGADESVLPRPAIGTRLAFRLIYPDTRGANGPARFVVKDLGSVVIGEGGPGIEVEGDGEGEGEEDEGGKDNGEGVGAGAVPRGTPDERAAGHRTLGDARFVVGDYISCAILPPLPSGAVAPASSARSGRGAGIGENRASISAPDAWREDGPEVRRGRGGRGGPGAGPGRGGPGGAAAAAPAGSNIPMGEWRRGERLPEAPSRGGRGGRGGRVRTRGRW